MRRVCVWCGRAWDASKLVPPMDQPYFCPNCERYEDVWRVLRKEVPEDASTVGKAHQDAGSKPALDVAGTGA